MEEYAVCTSKNTKKEHKNSKIQGIQDIFIKSLFSR